MDKTHTNPITSLFTNIALDPNNCSIKCDKLGEFDYYCEIYAKDTLLRLTYEYTTLRITINDVGEAEIDLKSDQIKLMPLGTSLFGVDNRPTDPEYDGYKIITFVANNKEFRIEIKRKSSNVVRFNLVLLDLGSSSEGPVRISFDLDTTNLMNGSSCCSG